VGQRENVMEGILWHNRLGLLQKVAMTTLKGAQ